MKFLVILPDEVGQVSLDCLRAVLETVVPEVGDDEVIVVATPRAAQLIVLADLALADDETVGKVEVAVGYAMGRGQNADPDEVSGTS